MKHDFNELINRSGTNSIKHDFIAENSMPSDIIPLWIADMDLRVDPNIINALIKACQHGIFGYSDTKDEYFNSLKYWFHLHHKWDIEKEWLIKTPGVVYALSTAIRALTKIGDSVLIQPPVYPPFSQSVIDNERILITNPLIYKNGSYYIDFDDFEKKIKENKIKLFILCSPHNPIGRIWSIDELKKLGDICLKYSVTILSDEIHADFAYRGYTHINIANINPRYQDITITCTAPSKTFNIAGLQVSNIFIANPILREAYQLEMAKTGYSHLNSLGLVACQAAYNEAGPWLNELKLYLENNLNFVRDFLKNRLPQIKLVEPQGTYLLWLDFNELNLNKDQLNNLIINEAKLWLNDGEMFGIEGQGFQRLNIACPQRILEKALLQLERAVKLQFNL